jgi:hypothetical protein
MDIFLSIIVISFWVCFPLSLYFATQYVSHHDEHIVDL